MYIKNKYSKILIVTFILCQLIYASYDMRIHKTDDSVDRIEVADIVDMTFQDGTSGKEIVIKRTSTSNYICATTDIDSITFQETGTVTDIDGNVYKTVKIGDQWWMAENLKVTHYNDASEIPYVTDRTAWAGLSSGAYCAYNNDIYNESDTYGFLYNWYAVGTGKLAPEGWHVSTEADWEELAQYISNQNGGYTKSGDDWEDVGTHLKFTSYDYGFAGLGAGYRGTANYYDLGGAAYFWTPRTKNTVFAFFRHLSSSSRLYRDYRDNRHGLSVRCVRD